MERYGWRRRKREAMHVGGGLFVRCRGVKKAGAQAGKMPPATNGIHRAICWLASGADQHLQLCLSTNTQKSAAGWGLVICHKALRGKKGNLS